MDYENGTYNFITKPIEVHTGQGVESFNTLVLREPSREHAKYALKLKQMVTKALFEISEKQPTDSNPEIGQEVESKTDAQKIKESEDLAEAIDLAITTSDRVDLDDFVETFIAMAEKTAERPVVLIDGKYTFKDAHTKQIKLDELQRMAVTYASFFLMPSVMQTR